MVAYIKEIKMTTAVAFAPSAPYMVVGTLAEWLDQTFSSTNELEIVEVDFWFNNLEFPVVWKVDKKVDDINERFIALTPAA